MTFDYIRIAPGYAREAIEAYDAWENKGEVPLRVQELMIVLRIGVSRRYGPPWKLTKNNIPTYNDPKLDQDREQMESAGRSA